MAAENVAAKTKHDGFESSMIEVRNEDWAPFIEELSQI